MDKGDHVADFELPDESGALRRLSEFLALGPVVIFFYPAAMSKGCTAESRHFRDLAAEFAALGAQRIGISTDEVARQQEFSKRNSLGYPLLSDRHGEVAAQFGVKRRFGPIPVKRWTFVIQSNGRVLEVIKSETRMTHHADRAVEVLRQNALAPTQPHVEVQPQQGHRKSSIPTDPS
ncbi:MAG: peroxiredoxin [Candidatus Dormiibacterota bacterium]